VVAVLTQYLAGRAAPRSAPPPGDWVPGQRRRRCLSEQTETESPAAHCNTASYEPSGGPASTATAPAAPSYTASGIRSPPSEVDVYTLMNLLGHESMMASQRYVSAAANQTRQAAASNRLYTLLD
jgi:hypothetical protein